DAGGAGAAVRLDDIAVDLDAAFAEFFQVDDSAQAAADQTLYFLGAAGLLALCSFTLHAAASGTWQHAVFRRNPALVLAAQERRQFFINAGGAQYVGIAEFDHDR